MRDELDSYDCAVSDVLVSSSGEYVVTSAGGNMRVWKLATR